MSSHWFSPGEDIVSWLSEHFNIDTSEARSVGSMLVALGYLYPLQDHKKLSIKSDASLYRFQVLTRLKSDLFTPFKHEQYNRLHKWMNHKWDFIVMQAKEQYRAAKERKKPDRVVFECQERAYWVVHRPPINTKHLSFVSVSLSADFYTSEIDKLELRSIYRDMNRKPPRVSFSLVKYCATYHSHDPFLSRCLPSNPWLTDDATYWTLNIVEVPTKQRVERWTFSFGELLSDPRGRDDFRLFLRKEFSGEDQD
uniref:Uncharacterized protein n=1 Tax=Periophthalmus magnuspinnatus TaxID=409849 RepID=A0A3B4BKU1_9GOBI